MPAAHATGIVYVSLALKRGDVTTGILAWLEEGAQRVEQRLSKTVH
jgi:hypothetical protein